MTWKGMAIVFLGLLAWAYVATAADSNEPPEITLDAHWSIEAAVGLGSTAKQIVAGSAMYWPDYANDGAVGVMIVGGDLVPEDECLVGPAVEFPVGDIYEAVVGRVLPSRIAEVFGNATAQMRPYGRAAILFDYDLNPCAVLGTGTRLFPNKKIQPVLRTDWYQPAGNSRAPEMSGWWTTLGVSVFF